MTPPASEDREYDEASALLAKIASLIGEVAIIWASLDNDLILLLSKLATCPPWSAGVIFYSLNSLNNQIAIIKGLATHCVSNKAAKDEILAILEKTRTLAKTRNTFIHSEYRIEYDPKKKKRKWKVVRHTFRSEANEIITEVNAQTGEFMTHKQQVENIKLSLKTLPSFEASGKRIASHETPRGLLAGLTSLATD